MSLLAFWRKLVGAGTAPGDNLDFIKLQKLGNQISLGLITVLTLLNILNGAILIYKYLHQQEIRTELYYCAVQCVAVSVFVIAYVLRAKTRRLGWFFLTHYGAATMVVALSALMGKDTYCHLAILAGGALPVFFLDAFRFRVILCHQGVTLLIVFGLFAWHEYHPAGIAPQEPELRILAACLAVGITYLISAVNVYYFWRQNHNNKLALIEERLVVQRQNEMLEQKDAYLQRELDLAFEIQRSILPPEKIEWQRLKIMTSYKPMGKVSGDYFEIREIQGSLFVLIADVSGHGVPAAMVSMLSQQIFSGLLATHKSPALILAEANRVFADLLKQASFISAFLMRIDPDMAVEYCNAGHHPPLYLRRGNTLCEELHAPGLAIGLTAQTESLFENRQMTLANGDRIFIFTDGLTEQVNPTMEEFGTDRLKGCLLGTLPDSHDKVFAEFENFRAGEDIADDITLLSIEVTSA